MSIPNREKLQELLQDFHNLTGMKFCLYDSAQNELCYFPEKLSPFCKVLREDAQMDENCRDCDRRAFAACKKTHKRSVYTCHAGLLECVSPILYNDVVIGYIVIGQIRTDADFSEIRSKLPAPLLEKLQESYERLPVIGMSRINASIRILDACAGYEHFKSIMNLADETIDSKIAAYIEHNLSGNLSVYTLCRVFRLSRSELYGIFHEHFAASVADFIKQRRLLKACDLLERTDAPISEVAVQCGIPDYNYFSKQFKKAFGHAPSTHRKQSL